MGELERLIAYKGLQDARNAKIHQEQLRHIQRQLQEKNEPVHKCPACGGGIETGYKTCRHCRASVKWIGKFVCEAGYEADLKRKVASLNAQIATAKKNAEARGLCVNCSSQFILRELEYDGRCKSCVQKEERAEIWKNRLIFTPIGMVLCAIGFGVFGFVMCRIKGPESAAVEQGMILMCSVVGLLLGVVCGLVAGGTIAEKNNKALRDHRDLRVRSAIHAAVEHMKLSDTKQKGVFPP